MCVLVRQLAAIYRTCYESDDSSLLRGINTSLGCRTWTNADNFTALYCFCDTNLCNDAPAHTRLRLGLRWAEIDAIAMAVATLVYVRVAVAWLWV